MNGKCEITLPTTYKHKNYILFQNTAYEILSCRNVFKTKQVLSVSINIKSV